MLAEIIVAAAGLSRRMGGWKPGVCFRGKPLLYHNLAAAMGTPWPVILVGGYNYRRLRNLVDNFIEETPSWGPRITLVENSAYRRGPAETFLRGLEESRGEWLFLIPGDLPLLTGETFEELYRRRHPPVCRPEYRNQPGHPVLLSRSVIPDILRRRRNILPTLAPEKELTMRQLVGAIHPVPWTDGGVIFDVDTPQLLREAQPSRSLQKGGGLLQEKKNESS